MALETIRNAMEAAAAEEDKLLSAEEGCVTSAPTAVDVVKTTKATKIFYSNAVFFALKNTI